MVAGQARHEAKVTGRLRRSDRDRQEDPSLDVLKRLARALGVPVTALLE
jgi:hypothetical protein